MAATNVLAIVKEDREKFVFLFDDASHDELLRQLGRSAGDPQLSFTWYDAALLSQKARRLWQQSQLKPQENNAPDFQR